MPGIFLFYHYNRNRVENILIFEEVLILAIIFTIVGVLLFFALKLIVNSNEGALIISIVGWSFFWLWGTIRGATHQFLPSIVLVLLMTAIIIFLIFFFRRYKPALEKARFILGTLSLCLVLVFAFNFVPGVYQEIIHRQRKAEMAKLDESERLFYIKEDFIIDPLLPSPDIYWFHMDGMLSFDSIETFFGDSQEELRKELENRGFVINSGAKLNAGSTEFALLALLSPGLYDSYFGAIMAENANFNVFPRIFRVWNKLAEDGLCKVRDLARHYELFTAFYSTGYTTMSSDILNTYLPISIDRFYQGNNVIIRTENDYRHRFFFTRDLRNLLSMTTPLSKLIELFNHGTPIPYCTDTINQLTTQTTTYAETTFLVILDSFTVPSPRLMFLAIEPSPHRSNWNKFSDPGDSSRYAPEFYMPTHIQSVKTMLTAIDLVLEENPNAIIVLQSDHGFHARQIQDYMLEAGYSEDLILEMYLSTFSAVRIPDTYGGLDTPLEPLNITRQLVNRFVGENYSLLPN